MIPRQRATTRREAGGTLIIAVIVVTMLTMLGLVAMHSASIDTQAAGAEFNSEAALFVSEAGVQWALQELDLTYDIDPANPDYSVITARPVVAADPVWGPTKIVGWHTLHDAVFMPYGDGSYRVVAQVADPPDNKTLIIRSLGVTGAAGIASASSRRLLEVAVQPQ